MVIAAKLFRKKGFLRVTIDEIASSLKMNKATIYYYFLSKEELLYEIVTNAISDLIKQAQDIINSNDSSERKMKTLIKLHLKIGTDESNIGGVAQFERKNLSSKLLKSYDALRNEYEQIYRNLLQKGMAMGEFQESDPIMTARFILGLVNSVTTWFKRNGSLTTEKMGDEVWKFISLSIYPSTYQDKYPILNQKKKPEEELNFQRNVK